MLKLTFTAPRGLVEPAAQISCRRRFRPAGLWEWPGREKGRRMSPRDVTHSIPAGRDMAPKAGAGVSTPLNCATLNSRLLTLEMQQRAKSHWPASLFPLCSSGQAEELP